MTETGVRLAQLLLGSYRTLVDGAIAELELRGFHDVRPVHEFAMQAIASGADSATELGRRLSVSKQAAAKTVQTLLERGYIAREPDPLDSRRKRLKVTPLGLDMIRQAEAIFNELRSNWELQLGKQQLALMERQLTMLAGDTRLEVDTPGWMANDAD